MNTSITLESLEEADIGESAWEPDAKIERAFASL